MSLYSVDKLITETRRIASEYRKATGKILPVTPEIAINDAISILQLTPNNDNSKPYDATLEQDDKPIRVQIKGRAIFNEKRQGHRIGQLKLEQEWDAIILVIMDAEFMPQEIYMASRDDIMNEMNRKASSNSKKGAMTLAKFKIIGTLLWTAENGLEKTEPWTNKQA